jgi:hypothetical protein
VWKSPEDTNGMNAISPCLNCVLTTIFATLVHLVVAFHALHIVAYVRPLGGIEFVCLASVTVLIVHIWTSTTSPDQCPLDLGVAP